MFDIFSSAISVALARESWTFLLADFTFFPIYTAQRATGGTVPKQIQNLMTTLSEKCFHFLFTVRFTTALFEQSRIYKLSASKSRKTDYFQLRVLFKWLTHFFAEIAKGFGCIKIFLSEKTTPPHYWSDKGKGKIVVNQEFPSIKRGPSSLKL